MEQPFTEFNRENLSIRVKTANGREINLGPHNVRVSYFSSGHGGQNVNKHQNGVQLIFPIPEEFILNGRKTKMLVSRCITQRSREQNLKEAFADLARKAERYFYVPPARKKTKTPRRAKETRLKDKKMRKMKKEGRRGQEY